MSSRKKPNSNSKSKKKIISSPKKPTTNSKSKNKIISSPKKPTKSSFYSIIKYVEYILTYTLMTMITTVAFAGIYSNNFKLFVLLVINSLSLSYMYNKHMKTPTKVDSQKNIIKLPLSTFKSYVKKIVEILKPAISVMSSSLKLLAFLLLVKTILELSKESEESKKGMFEYVRDLFISNKIVKNAELSYFNIDFSNLYNLYKNYSHFTIDGLYKALHKLKEYTKSIEDEINYYQDIIRQINVNIVEQKNLQDRIREIDNILQRRKN